MLLNGGSNGQEMAEEEERTKRNKQRKVRRWTQEGRAFFLQYDIIVKQMKFFTYFLAH